MANRVRFIYLRETIFYDKTPSHDTRYCHWHSATQVHLGAGEKNSDKGLFVNSVGVPSLHRSSLSGQTKFCKGGDDASVLELDPALD